MWSNPQQAAGLEASLSFILHTETYALTHTHVVPLENVLVAASLLGTFLKAPCHPQLFQENNLTRGQP